MRVDVTSLVDLRDTCVAMLERRNLEYSSFLDMLEHLSGTTTFWKYAKAREHFAQENLGLVYKIVLGLFGRYAGAFGKEDLIHEGLIGLLRAVDLYQPDVAQFSTYASWWIRHTTQRGIENKLRIVRLPSYQISNVTRLSKKKELTEEEQKQLSELKAKMFCIFPKKEVLFRDKAPDPADRAEVRRMLQHLDSRTAYVLCESFGLSPDGSKSLQEIGNVLGLSRERVRQIKETGLEKLREKFT